MGIDLERHLGGSADVVKADQVRGKTPTITITGVSEVEFADGHALYVHFETKGKKRRVKVNARSARELSAALGRSDPERQWVGKQVRLVHTPGGTPQYDSITLEPVNA